MNIAKRWCSLVVGSLFLAGTAGLEADAEPLHWEAKPCSYGQSGWSVFAGSPIAAKAGTVYAVLSQSDPINFNVYYMIAEWNNEADCGDWRELTGFGPAVVGAGMPLISVVAMTVHGNYLYVAGRFPPSQPGTLGNIAKYDLINRTWSAVGGGLPDDRVPTAIAVDDAERVYVGFDHSYNGGGTDTEVLIMWNNSAWVTVGGGLIGNSVPGYAGYSAKIAALAVDGNNLYVAGHFLGGVNSDNTSQVLSRSIIKWNGTQWLPMGQGIQTESGVEPPVWDVAVLGDKVFVAASYYQDSIHMWKGPAEFTTGGTFVRDHLITPEGVSPGPGAPFAEVYRFAKLNGVLYMSGNFDNVDGTSGYHCLARVFQGDDNLHPVREPNQSNGIRLGHDPNSSVSGYPQGLTADEHSLYLNGNFDWAGSIVAPGFARWTDLSSDFAPATDGPINDIAVQNDGLILLAGAFTHVNGDHSCRFVARLDERGFADDTFNNNAAWVIANHFVDVNCVAVDRLQRVYVGGDFLTEDGTSRGRLIRLDPQGGLDKALNDQSDFVFDTDDWGTILTIGGGGHEIWWDPANHETDITVGGNFGTLAGVPNNNLVDIMIGDTSWGDGVVESAGDAPYLGITPHNWIYSSVHTSRGVVACGDTTFTDGDYEIGSANYDGDINNWTFSGGADDAAYALALQADGKMLLGGRFTVLGYSPYVPGPYGYGSPHNYLGRFNANGTIDESFHPTAGGVVNTLLIQSDGLILAGGAAGLQRFHPNSNPDNVNFGINGTVNKVIQQSDQSIIAVGSFSSAGGQPHANIVRFGPDALKYGPTLIQSFASIGVNPNALVWSGSVSGNSFSFLVSGPPASTWQVWATSDWINWSQHGTVTIPSGGQQNVSPLVLGGTVTSFTDNTIAGVPQRFYFLVRQVDGTHYSSQAIGFTKITAGCGTTDWSKLTALANQLDAYPNNTLSSVFAQSSLPAGTSLHKDNVWYTWNGSSWSGSTTLAPGEGAVLQNNSGSAFTVTFVGTVKEGHLVDAISGNQVWSSIVPQAGGITSALNYQPTSGDVVYRWATPNPGWNLAGIYFNAFDAEDQTGIYNTAGWYDGYMNPTTEPAVNVGEGFVIQAGGWFGLGSNDWVRDFSVFEQFSH